MRNQYKNARFFLVIAKRKQTFHYSESVGSWASLLNLLNQRGIAHYPSANAIADGTEK